MEDQRIKSTLPSRQSFKYKRDERLPNKNLQKKDEKKNKPKPSSDSDNIIDDYA